jgi:ketosteroid isomerase-like protein
VAFAHGLCRCGAKDESGEEKTSWMRFTTCYRRTSGSWKIVHEHFSAPFDVESGKALFDLKP